MRNPFKIFFRSKKINVAISKSDPGNLVIGIFEIYTAKKRTMIGATEKEISHIIFSEIYPTNSPKYSLAEQNKSGISDLRHVIYCIINMEFDGARNIDTLSEMYLEALNKLSILNHKPACDEMKLLLRIMDKATINDVDPIWAATYAIRTQLHYSPDYEEVMEEMFKIDKNT